MTELLLPLQPRPAAAKPDSRSDAHRDVRAGGGATTDVRSDVRYRWRMGSEARMLVLVSAILCAFGLAVLYSSSAFVAVADHGSSMFFFIRQVEGLGAGILMFLITAKVDAERLRRWAWPIMWFT